MLIRKRPLWADAAPQGYSWQAEGGLDDCPQVPWATTLHNTQPAEQLLEALGLAFVIKRQHDRVVSFPQFTSGYIVAEYSFYGFTHL